MPQASQPAHCSDQPYHPQADELYDDFLARIMASHPSSSTLHEGGDYVIVDTTWKLGPSSKCYVYPISSSMFGRYERNVVIPKTDSQYVIEPLTTIYNHRNAPSGWIPMTHPEGTLYFFQEQRRVLTDAYLYDPEVFATIVDCICQLDEIVQAKNILQWSNVDLVLDLTSDENGEKMCGYYFADHQNRTLFWLEAFDASSLLEEVRGVTSLAHIGHEIESQYWAHWELFPNVHELSHTLVSELREIIVHNIGDSLTSSTSTSPYDTARLKEMLNLVNHMSVDVGNRSGHSGCVFGRLMSTFAHQKFLHFHGQNGVRLNRDQSVHGTSCQSSWVVKQLSPVFFYAPNVHLKELTKIWVDELVCHVHWNNFLDKVISEWQEYALYAALLLNANIGLLAIASVGSEHTQTRSPAQITGCISLAASVCAIIMSLLLLRQYRTKDRRSATEAGTILSVNGVETLAIICSLPYVCLMWGLVTFVMAVSFMCYQKTNNIPRLLIGIPSLALAIAVFWSIWMGWDSTGSDHWLSKLWNSLRSRTSDRVHWDESDKA